ncbi:MAG: hypothetical protein KF830_06305 [Planctomycetes bacterium]|nr:hypothetical protein [Planctomycetota bacterium]
MRNLSLVAVALLAALPSCYQFQVSAQAAYAQLSVDGNFGYQNGTGTVAVEQSVESALGLGDDRGSPYGRIVVDTGVPVFSVSGFLFDETGDGLLTADFGDLTAGTAVRSDLELWNAKAALAFQIELGPVSVAPGLAANYVDLDLTVQDVFGAVRERVQLSGPLPMLFLRAQVELGMFAAIVEGAYSDLDLDDVDAKLLDLEALVEARLGSTLTLMAGYRYFDLQADGEVDGDALAADFTVRGFFLGGGVRF